MFKNCLLYSWILLTWISNKESKLNSTPVLDLTNYQSLSLLWRLMSAYSFKILTSSAILTIFFNSSWFKIQSSDLKCLSKKADNLGLHNFNQRRGVTPFVLLLNFYGLMSTNSLNKNFFNNSEWSAATPLTEWEPTILKLAILIF